MRSQGHGSEMLDRRDGGPARRDRLAIPVQDDGAAAACAAALLESLAADVEVRSGGALGVPADLAWARSGAMALTGEPDGPALPAPSPVATCAAAAAAALVALARATTGRAPDGLDGAALLGERAALSDPPRRRAGRRSVGGSCRMLPCADGWLALNLARPDDAALLPAWLEQAPAPGRDPWAFAAEALRGRARDALVARARLVGLAVAPVVAGEADAGAPRARAEGWLRVAARGARRPVPMPGHAPLVVDLSSLWAGPLCGQLLAACGARVVKVESLERPDGARGGPRAFFDLLNGQKESMALPFRTAAGRRALAALLARADVVIEASRPRALEQLGIDAGDLVARHGVTWVGISGHGRRAPGADWVAFGDDAAAGAGLVATTAEGLPCFCGDAVADPLAGLHAALAALAVWSQGGGQLLDVSLHGVAAWVRARPAVPAEDAGDGVSCERHVAPPRARPARGRAPGPGRDTSRVLAELGIRC